MRQKLLKLIRYFSVAEWILWCGSMLLIVFGFYLYAEGDGVSFAASLVGVTSLIFNAKGNPFGQVLMIVFSILYGVISYRYSYFGEMITYLGMTMPMAVYALVMWLRNPFQGNHAQVEVNRLRGREVLFMLLLSGAVSIVFWFILRALHTQNLLPSTVSVFTSFLAAYLTARRSAYFALAYASNDIVLIVLWALAVRSDASYVPVLVCFGLFLVNDLYGFLSWLRMRDRQKKKESEKNYEIFENNTCN